MPAPYRRACRRTNQLPIPASGARTTRLATGTPPIVQLSVRDRLIVGSWYESAVDPFAALAPWTEIVQREVPGVELFDAHTHLGQNDPDGMKQSPAELLEMLGAAQARGAFVFPMHEPDGYPPANDMVIEAAARADGLLTPFCRVSPHNGDARAEAERALGAGAKGIKLHPRAE